MAKAGRKPKLTSDLIKRLGEALRAGNYVETACDYVGISPQTLYRWLQESQELGAKPIYRELSDTIKAARAEAEMRNVLRIQKAADESWQAAAWWLERSHPKKWSKSQSLELSGANGAPINIAVDTKTALLALLSPEKNDDIEPKDLGL